MSEVTVPELDLDKRMLDEFGEKLSSEQKLERKIVANLIHHMAARNFTLTEIDNGTEEGDVVLKGETLEDRVKEAMELVFDVSDSFLHFDDANAHWAGWIRLIPGTGIDIVCDWTIDNSWFDERVTAFADGVDRLHAGTDTSG